MLMMHPPVMLYKYRSWNNEWDKRNLTHHEIYFASFDQFNDPYDGAIPFRFKPEQLTEENIFNKYYLLIEEMCPQLNPEQINALWVKYKNKGPLKDAAHLSEIDNYLRKELAESFGIISLAPAADNYLMWSHYSNKHTGYCIGYNTPLLIEQTAGSLFPVKYNEQIPRIDMFKEDNLEIFYKLAFTKSKLWSYENEIRIIKSGSARKAITLTPETIAEIYLGCSFNQIEKDEVLKICSEKYPQAAIFEMQLNRKDEYKLIPIQIN